MSAVEHQRLPTADTGVGRYTSEQTVAETNAIATINCEKTPFLDYALYINPSLD